MVNFSKQSGPISIRKLTESSAAKLYDQFKNNELYRFAVNESIKPLGSSSGNRCHYGAFSEHISEEKTIGYMQGYYPDYEGHFWIQTFIINEEYTRKGYGSKFFHLVMEQIEQNNPLTNVYLACYDANTRGCLFWESLGFTVRTTTEKADPTDGEIRKIIIYQRNPMKPL